MKTAKLFLSPLRRAKSRRDSTLLTAGEAKRNLRRQQSSPRTKSSRDSILLTVCFSLRAILLLAPTFFFCASLHAQVTIGGAEIPKSGAILDLNSTAKGGLVLSNVSLGNLSEIPSSFPGTSAANPADLKKGLTGSVIYNTNPAFCTGVHLWNGQHWGRITAETPVYTPGTLSIASNTDDLFGGAEVEFTAASGAKIYRWYASINNDPYEYLGATTIPAFSEIFPAGNNKVKVIMDDCLSLKESNGVTFAPGSVSPNFGSLAGGNYIYIYGDFPYAATDDYAAQSNLVAHFDGINNRGLGDKQHDYSSTASWKDLKNPTFDLPRGVGGGQWLSNGFQALSNDTMFYSSTFPYTSYPLGNDERTVEIIFRTPEEDEMFEQITNVQRRIFVYGVAGTSEVSNIFSVLYRGATRLSCLPPEYQWVFYAIGGNMNNLVTCLSSTPSLEKPNTINTVTSTYHTGMADERTNSYINNISATIVERSGSLNTLPGDILIGINLSRSTFLSVRLYNRVLTSAEIALNAELDQKRYLTPPDVTIDSKHCTEVVVLSPHFLMCKVPVGTTVGTKNVAINGVISGAYKYVDPVSDFYVSSISPIVGSVGTTLTLEGNRLDEISVVSVGGVPCTNVIYQDAVKYECELLSNSPGEVDITIKLTDNIVYRFARVFEYR